MTGIITVAIGVGLAVSLVFSELFGLAAGGMVVPGYFALFLDQPVNISMTVVAALLTFFLVHLLSNIVIVYGKRRTVLMILIGFLVRSLFDALPVWALTPLQALQAQPMETTEPVQVIGYIIPGLIAIWLDRQGVVETLSALFIASTAIRLILILAFGTELHL
ncbi:poly-gamma-glutamate biosynthesis protein PgsC [Bremerella sp. T1]|uniref:poly-gamma-glutamate biosynthesis protein PgsC n=1 Tax=Bremerella sp. TYQ1 TaxID=3119568 RepID=UPI001CCD5472|nr:poly-gamma-glutamate biosynthesis protein PgsC [Bremerella volcania]UBM34079.1 poly-gamma-glutamate biosynthesis protein PgsC [Bremerella volcania]